jgi:hypothetical protein
MASVNIVQAKGDIFISKKKQRENMFILHQKKIEDKLPKDLFLKVHAPLLSTLKKSWKIIAS